MAHAYWECELVRMCAQTGFTLYALGRVKPVYADIRTSSYQCPEAKFLDSLHVDL